MHHVTVVPKTTLAKYLGTTSDTIAVNSFHHQAVKQVATGFQVVAQSADQVVEAIEATAGGLQLGVQWHPEMMQQVNSVQARLFAAFVRACVA